jgi:TM2 domain-containing membrane protein YozV
MDMKMREKAHVRADYGMVYLLWFFGGWFGLHRFYMGYRNEAITMVILNLIIIGIPVTLVWWIVDLFYIEKLYLRG